MWKMNINEYYFKNLYDEIRVHLPTDFVTLRLRDDETVMVLDSVGKMVGVPPPCDELSLAFTIFFGVDIDVVINDDSGSFISMVVVASWSMLDEAIIICDDVIVADDELIEVVVSFIEELGDIEVTTMVVVETGGNLDDVVVVFGKGNSFEVVTKDGLGGMSKKSIKKKILRTSVKLLQIFHKAIY